MPRADAPAKVTGRITYGHDLLRPGMLVGKILRSPHAHARIVHVNADRARRLAGVHAVLTGADTPNNTFGLDGAKEILQRAFVRRVGDEVAAIAAVDADTADEALELIDVVYEPLPAVFDPLEALAPGSPKVHRTRESNLYRRLDYLHGDPDSALSAAKVVVEDSFSLPYVAPFPLEPSFCLAEFNPDGTLTVYSTTQAPYLFRFDLARALAIPAGKIRVVQPAIGGAFGRGLDLYAFEPVTALLAQACGKPVYMAFDRREEFIAAPVRQPVIATGRAGACHDGRLMVRDIHVTLDIGAYASLGTVIPKVMAQAVASLYRVPHARFIADLVYTNNPITGAMRGFGGPQATFIVEVLMDQLAAALGTNPLSFRLQNANQANETTPQGLRISTCDLQNCLRHVQTRASQLKPRNNEAGWRRGVGYAAALNVGGGARMHKSDGCGAVVQVDDYGHVSVITGATEIGQGATTVLAQIVAESIGVSVNNVTVVNGDTAIAPWDVGVHASRTTFVAGNAARLAAEDARRQILETAGELLEVAVEDLTIRDGYVFVRGAPESRVDLGKVVRARHFRSNGQIVVAHSWYEPRSEFVGDDMRGNLSATYSFAAQAVEVDVNVETGVFRVVRVTVAADVGRAINPMLVEGQLEGGICMGLGYATSERLMVEHGRVQNTSLREYGMFTTLDMPVVEIALVGNDDPQGPFGAKGVGEIGVAPVAAALSNAIYDACGVRITNLPLLAEKVYSALHPEEDPGSRNKR